MKEVVIRKPDNTISIEECDPSKYYLLYIVGNNWYFLTESPLQWFELGGKIVYRAPRFSSFKEALTYNINTGRVYQFDTMKELLKYYIENSK